MRSPSANGAANWSARNSRRLIGRAHLRFIDGESDNELRVELRRLAGRARWLKIRSRPTGSMKAGRRKPLVKPSMNREMCASLRPKGPVRKVPTSYDCSAGSPGFNGGQHTYGGRARLSRGRCSSPQDVARNLLRENFTGRLTSPRRPGLPSAGTAGSDSGRATTASRVMRRGPFHHHHQPADCPLTTSAVHSLILPSGDSWYLPRPWPTDATSGRRSPRPCVATGCTATST